ncbi:hypothetical protein FACS1894219_08780 [Clostridia bacterium]|nr:hypothetical protein FACS1894219_08780 [Clostridia bacterium]
MDGFPEDLPISVDELVAENKKLRSELKKTARELNFEKTLNQRNKVAALAKNNLASIVTAEKSRLEQYMKLLLTSCPDLILIFDNNGKIDFASESFYAAMSISGIGMIKDRTYTELLGEVIPGVESLFESASVEKTTINSEGDFNFGNGIVRHYLLQITPMLNEIDDGSGDVVGTIAMFYDTTELTDAVRAAQIAKDEALAARETAEQANQAKSSFLSNMSHEMRTPMNAIIGMTTIAKSSNDIDRKNYCLKKIEEASTHLLGVINDILDMSKIEAGKFELSAGDFNFEQMIHKVVSVINFRVEEKNQHLSVEIAGDIPKYLRGDDLHLSQVIANLLSNAVKFTPDGGSIKLTALLYRAENGKYMIEISVSDTGIGISPEQQTRLFSSFQQADTGTSRKFGGTGLGLAISKRIVEMMDGAIWIESSIGSGSTFRFRVSLGKASEAMSEAAVSSAFDIDGDGIDDFSAYTILLAEDVEINREIVLSLLEDTRLNIDCAENGRIAVEKYKAAYDKYSMIFMDIQMPEMDGFEATRNIRSFEISSGLPKKPIVAMTANVFREDIMKCLESGMNSHVGKPLDFAEVMAKLHMYLNS